MALSAILKTAYAPEAIQLSLDYLINQQLPNGSWNDKPYETAVALRAIYEESVEDPAGMDLISVNITDASGQTTNEFGPYEKVMIGVGNLLIFC